MVSIAAPALRPNDTSGNFRASRIATQRERAANNTQAFVGSQTKRPTYTNSEPINTALQTPANNTQAFSAGDRYKINAAQRRTTSRIVAGNKPFQSNQLSPDLNSILAQAAAERSQALVNNQLGNDMRSRSAKVADMETANNSAMQLVDTAIEAGTSYAVSSVRGFVSVFDWGQDGFMSWIVAAITQMLGAMRSILTPPPPPLSDASTPQEKGQIAVERGKDLSLDIPAPRMDVVGDERYQRNLGLAVLQLVAMVVIIAVILGIALMLIVAFVGATVGLWAIPFIGLWYSLPSF